MKPFVVILLSSLLLTLAVVSAMYAGYVHNKACETRVVVQKVFITPTPSATPSAALLPKATTRTPLRVFTVTPTVAPVK